jgi:hypothetical protein
MIADEEDVPVLKRMTVAGSIASISCGVADYLAQEEMHRYFQQLFTYYGR